MTVEITHRYPRRRRETRALPFAFDAGAGGAFEGYASLFGVADRNGDVVARGAFRRAIAERGPSRIRMLYQHQAIEPIGVWESLEEDARGLRVAGHLSTGTARGRDVLALLRDGALDGLSIGFRTRRARTDRASGLRHLLDCDLWEISVVTFPMLEGARVTAVAPLAQPHRPPLAQAFRAAARAFSDAAR